jgi:hypothetical protein
MIHGTGIARSMVAIAIGSLLAFPTGCSVFSNQVAKVNQSANGSVSIEEVTDWSFEASHPAMVDQGTIAKVLRGVQVEEWPGVSDGVPASGSRPMKAFSDENVEYLAPLLAQALSQAKPEQVVGFQVFSSAGSGSGPAAGTVYVQKGAVHVTLTQFAGQTPKSSVGSWLSFDKSRSTSKPVVSFYPVSVARVVPAPSSVAQGVSNVQSVVVDYASLAKTPVQMTVTATKVSPTRKEVVPAAAHVRQEAVSPEAVAVPVSANGEMSESEFLAKKLDELRQSKERVAQKDAQIKALRRDMESMRKQLEDRDKQIRTLKAKKVSSQPTKKKKAEVAVR